MNKNVIPLFDLTSPQQSIYNSIIFYNKSRIFNISATLTFTRKIDPQILDTTLNKLVEMNDALRIRLFKTQQGTRQYVTPYTYEPMRILNFKNKCAHEIEQELSNVTKHDLFGYHKQLYDFAIIKYDNCYGCYLKVSHLVIDGWSLVMLGMQLEETCRKLLSSEKICPRPSYVSFIKRDKEYLPSKKYHKDHAYWSNMLSAGAQITHFKEILGIYTEDSTMKASREKAPFTKEMTRAIGDFCKKNGFSLFSMFTAVIAIYLSRMSQSEDITIGTLISNRSHEEKKTVGMFVSLLPLRVEISYKSSFLENIQSTSRRIMNTIRHRQFPSEHALEIFRNQNNTPQLPYDVVISFQNASFTKTSDTLDYNADWHFNGYEPNTLLISIGDRAAEGNLMIEADYRDDILDQSRVKKILDHLRVLIQDGICNPQKKCSELKVLTHTERHDLLHELNQPKGNRYHTAKTLQQLFEDQAERTPMHPAVVSDFIEMTYEEINRRANQLARHLKKFSIRADVPVGIMVDRSVEMVVGILAVLKAGGCYLPIDPGYPEKRTAYILKDSHVNILLTQKRIQPSTTLVRAICIDLTDEGIYSGPSDNLPCNNTPEDLAYIMYTSGSTGNPKGVAVPHRSLVTRLMCMKRDYDIQRNDIFIQKTSSMFDVSITEIFLPLVSGCRLVIPPPGIEREPDKLVKYLNTFGVTIVNFVPSMLTVFLEFMAIKNKGIRSIRYLFCAGESLSMDQVKKAKKILGKSLKIANQYGPTETSYSSACIDVKEGECVHIGKPMDGTTFYILDRHGKLVPRGIRGEIYIGGSGLARGYVSNEKLTHEKFMESPFTKNAMLYRTGDYGRWLADGNIEFLGREDRQVKVRGFRVELGEIERALEEYNTVNQAVVLIEKGRLVSYISTNYAVDTDKLKRSLRDRLPLYMIPSHFCFLEKMPLTRNGKVDKQALIGLERHDGNDHIARECLTDDEYRLGGLWENALGVKPVSIEDDFFEMGGDSLKAVSLALEIERVFNAEFPVGEIYKSRTIKEQAHLVKHHRAKAKEGVILLRKGVEGGKTIFFVHGGSGSIGGYVNMFSVSNGSLDKRFTVYGIRYDRMNSCAPKEEKIEDLAIDYLERIKRVKKGGVYNLAAWCIGAQIITEIAFLFETEGFETGKLIFFNSIAPREWEGVEGISLEGEKRFGSRLMADERRDHLGNCQTIDEVWDRVLVYSKENSEEVLSRIPKDWLESIPNYKGLEIAEILYYLNCMRALNAARATYKPKGRLKGRCVFINPKEDRTIPSHLKSDNIRAWSKYFENPIKVMDVRGNEHSIFDEDIDDTIRALNSILI